MCVCGGGGGGGGGVQKMLIIINFVLFDMLLTF